MTDLRIACIHGRYDAHDIRPSREFPHKGNPYENNRCPGGQVVTEAEIITAYLTRTNATGGNVDADAI